MCTVAAEVTFHLAVAGDVKAGRAAPRGRLAARRRALGLTQEDLAARLRIERSTVVRWERGTTEPQPWLQPKLARALQVPVGRLTDLLAGPGKTALQAGDTSPSGAVQVPALAMPPPLCCWPRHRPGPHHRPGRCLPPLQAI